MIDENELLFNELYEKTKDCGRVQFINLLMTKERENKQLKKQLEEYKHKSLYNTCLPYSTGYKKAIKEKENQQKEFIEYLENMLDNENDIFSVVRVKDVLSKYKEIIGDDK